MLHCNKKIVTYTPTELTQNPPEGIVAGGNNYSSPTKFRIAILYSLLVGPKSEENFFEWEALIT